MRKTAIVACVAGLAVVVAAGGYYGIALHEGQVVVDRTAARIRQALGPNGSLAYQSPEIHPFSRSASFAHVVLKRADGATVTADQLTVAPDGANSLRDLHGIGVTVSSAAGTLKAATLDAGAISYLPAADGTPVDAAALSFDTLTLHDGRLTASGQDTGFATLRIDQYGLGRRSRLEADKLSFVASAPYPVGPISAETLHVSGLDLAALSEAAQHRQEPGPQTGTLDADAEGVALRKGEATVLTVDRMALNGKMGWAEDGRSRLVITGATSTPADPQGITALKGLGLDSVHWGLVVQSDSKPSAGRASLSDFTLTARDLGTLAIGMDFSHLDVAALRQASAAGQAVFAQALSTMQLDGVRLRLVDAGILGRVFAERGRQMNMSGDQMRQMVLGLIHTNSELQFMLPQQAIRDAVARFVEKGGTLSLSATPNPPQTIAQLGALVQTLRVDPDGVTKQLGLAGNWQAPGAAGP